MAIATMQDLVHDEKLQLVAAGLDRDAEAALAQLKSNLSSGAAKSFPASWLNKYRTEGKALEHAQHDFTAEWNYVLFGKAKDARRLSAALTKYLKALVALAERNEQFAAVVDSGTPELAAGWVALMIMWQKEAAKRFISLGDELAELKKMLERAESNVREAELQRKLNVAISVISLALGPVSVAGRVAVAAGGITVHTIIDAALGPSPGSVLGTANTTASEIAGVSKKLAPAAQKLAGGLGALVTLNLDSDEVAQARKIVEQVRVRLDKAQKEYVMLARIVEHHAAKLSKLYKALDAAIKAARAKSAHLNVNVHVYDPLVKGVAKTK